MREQAGWLEDALLRDAPGDDRRASDRHPSALQVVCRPLGGSDGTIWHSQLNNVSTFGAGLLLPVAAAPGVLLRIDFAAATSGVVRGLLGRVVHATMKGDNWQVGCAFVRELDESALRRFQVTRVRAPAGDSRRWVRFPCDVEAVCYSLDTAPGERSPARIVNASAGGLGLLLPCEFGPGTLLRLDVPVDDASRVLLRVARAEPRDHGDWFLGCEFADWLDERELRVLL